MEEDYLKQLFENIAQSNEISTDDLNEDSLYSPLDESVEDGFAGSYMNRKPHVLLNNEHEFLEFFAQALDRAKYEEKDAKYYEKIAHCRTYLETKSPVEVLRLKSLLAQIWN